MAVTTDPTDTTPALPPHASTRWTSRSAHPEIGLTQAWNESVPIKLPSRCPWGPKGTLHDPGNVVLIYDEAREPTAQWVIKTVIHAELLGTDHSIIDRHLEVCDLCGYRYEPWSAVGCHWCELGYGPGLDELVEKLNDHL